MSQISYNILDIVDGTIVDGPGLRTAIYFAGCKHHCPGCHNPQSWDFDAGEPMTLDDIIEHIRENDFDVTFTGGDPMFIAEKLVPLAKAIKALGKTIWCYTGFTYNQLMEHPEMATLLDYIDVLVDGPYIDNLRDISLRFRGSSNQNIIELK